MKLNILIIEPNYKNKYPPLGLMKISSYHKLKGDKVVFYKGCSEDLRNRKWDRIYITTLFSFYWKRTIKTINYYKDSVKESKNLLVGGILATTMYDELIEETGIVPLKGLLNKPGILGNDDIIVDNLTPDYDILETIDYTYPTNSAYISYMTRGCCNHCAFCAVPQLEPKYINYISIKKQVEEIDSLYGKKRNLLLMDNNVLASTRFDDIIDEIIDLGFNKQATYIEPNYLELYNNRLIKYRNDKIAKEKIKEILRIFPEKRLKNQNIKDEFVGYIEEFGLLDEENNNYGKLFATRFKKAYSKLLPIYEMHRNKIPKQRYVDFNQGIDARLLTAQKMKRLSEINIKPLRIAFDNIKLKEQYIEKIHLAARYGIRELSNYVLYNYNDTPEDLYNRLKLNINLNEELDLKIYSFPMKYIPINDKNRYYIYEPYWKRKYLRTVQAILNVTHGAVMPRRDFFERAFGKNIEEFKRLLIMPEDYVYYRNYCEETGLVNKWENQIKNLKNSFNGSYEEALSYIHKNSFTNLPEMFINENVMDLLIHYKNRVDLTKYKKWKELK